MRSVDYVGALTRRWKLLLATAFVGAVIAILIPVSHPPHPAGTQRGPVTEPPHFQASTAIGPAPAANGNSNGSSGNSGNQFGLTFGQAVLYAGSDQVFAKTAAAVHYPGDPNDLRKVITLSANSTNSSSNSGNQVPAVLITAKAGTAAGAVLLANTYTSQLTAYLAGLTLAAQQQAIAAASAHVTQLQDQMNNVASQLGSILASHPSSSDTKLLTLQAQSQGLSSAYSVAYQTYASIASQPAPGAGIVVLQPASSQQTTAVGTSLLNERRVRGPLGALIGLLVGAAAALVLQQLDRKIRSRSDAETAFGLPVLAEVPHYALEGTSHDVVVMSAPSSRSAEAYRSLRTILVQRPMPNGASPGARVPASGSGSASGGGAPGSRGGCRVVVLAAANGEPTRGVGAANLAAAFAEAGQSVLVLSTQRRHATGPQAASESQDAGERLGAVRLQAGAERYVGSSHAATAPASAATLESVARQSSLDAVATVNLWDVQDSPGQLSNLATELIGQARGAYDVVLVEVEPVLSSHDAGALAPMADTVVLIAECAHTTVDQASRTSEILTRLGAPVQGLLLTQAPVARSPHRLFGSRDPSARSDGRRFAEAGSEALVTSPAPGNGRNGRNGGARTEVGSGVRPEETAS